MGIDSLTASPKRSSRPSQVVRLFVVAALVLLACSWARLHFASLRVDADPASEPDLAAAQERAQPLLDALEKYRADNGLYPASLSQLSSAYLASPQGLGAFRYSARHSDWVFQSDACLDPETAPRTQVPQKTKYDGRKGSRSQRDCVSGYREYQLQSPDFPPAAGSRYLERWAYYDSQPQYWTVGWCEQVAPKGNLQELATNGVCQAHQNVEKEWVADR